LLPGPAVHPDLAALAALPAADQDRAAREVKIALGQAERFADAQPRAPEHNDQAPQPEAIDVLAAGPRHGDDLLDRGWVRRVSQSFVARRASLVIARHGSGRSPSAGAIEQERRLHDVLLWEVDEMSIVSPENKRPTTSRNHP
jgi:hypothetical protein